MKFRYLGTAAAEGWPAIFCDCEHCRRAASAGGRNIRSRSQALIDDALLIDFPPDTYMHVLQYGIKLFNVQHCLITHTHSDHFYLPDTKMRMDVFAYFNDSSPLMFYGGEALGNLMLPVIDEFKDRYRNAYTAIEPYKEFAAGAYRIVALNANHDPKSSPFIYNISDGENLILYGNDTGYFTNDTWQWLEDNRPVYSFVSLDCTLGINSQRYNHMGLDTCSQVADRLRDIGCVNDNTKICVHHFSHNSGSIYDELLPIAAKKGFLVSYDGMLLDI